MGAVTKVVPSSLQVRMRLWRQRIFPPLIWLMAAAVAALLFQRQARQVDALGLVQTDDVVVTPVENGSVQVIQVALLDEVTPGQVVALMDDGVIEAELKVAESEMGRLRVEFNAGRAALKAAGAKAVRRRILLDREEAQLKLIRLQIQHEVNKVIIERTERVQARQRIMVESNILDQTVYQETTKRYAALETESGETEALIQTSQEAVAALQERAADLDDLARDVALENMLLPLQQGIAEQRARILEVQTRRANRIIRSPIAGVVTKVFRRAGDTMLAGTPLLRISNPNATMIVAFLDEGIAPEVEIGAEVQVFSSTGPRNVLVARVSRVGTVVVERPIQIRKHQDTREWGVPVLLTQLPAAGLYPGQVVELRLVVD